MHKPHATTLIAAAVFPAFGLWLASVTPSAEIAVVMGIQQLTVFLFAFEVVPVDVAAVTGLVLLGLLGCLGAVIGLPRPLVPPAELFDGFAGNAVISIIGVMIIGAGLDKTGLMARLAGVILRLAGQTKARIIPAVFGTVGLISSFMQNIGAAPMCCRVAGTRRSLTPPAPWAISKSGTDWGTVWPNSWCPAAAPSWARRWTRWSGPTASA